MCLGLFCTKASPEPLLTYFSTLLALCDGFASQRPVTWSFDVFFDLHLNKRLSKQSKRRQFETPSCSLWHHFNEKQKGAFKNTLPCHNSGNKHQNNPWALSQYKDAILPVSYDRLTSTMGFPILVRWHLYIESGPRALNCTPLQSIHYVRFILLLQQK